MTSRGRAKSNSAMFMQGLGANTIKTDPGSNAEEEITKSSKKPINIASRHVQTKTPVNGKTQ